MRNTSSPSRAAIFATVLGLLLLPSATIAQEDLTRDLSVEQRPIAGLAAQRSDLEVRVWADRRDATYATGETATLYVKVNRDAYITVLDVGTSGRVHVIFPNRYQPDNRVEAHQVLQVPGEDAPFRLRVHGPAGRELIKVFASTEPLRLYRAEDVEELGAFGRLRPDTESLTRDLQLELKRPRTSGVATANKVLTILARGAGFDRPQRLSAMTKTSPDEQFAEAEAHFYGEAGGGRPNYREAMRWYLAAAEAGHVQAMLRIGRMHEDGRDVHRDPDAALTWYQRAAERGNTQAMVRLARLHAFGEITRKDLAAAVRWLKQAAGQGDGVALQTLARMHDEGLGVDKDPRQAARLIIEAVKASAWTAIDQAARMSTETRMALQTELRQAGLYRGPVDGQIGSATRAALGEVGKMG